MKKLFTLIVIIASVSASGQSLRKLYQDGIAAYDAKDYELFKQKMLTFDSLRPNYPPVVYNLAGAHALTGNSEKSLKILKQYILMDATQDFSQDADFASLINSEGFKEITNSQQELTKDLPVQVKHEFPLLSAHLESITYSKKNDAFYLGGVRDGRIWVVEEGQEPKVFAESPENSWAVMGIEVSNDNKTLWACTSSMQNYEDWSEEDNGKVSVLKYNLKKGTLLETFALPAKHNFGDMITDSDGNAYISDGTANQLYWINKKTNKLEVLADLSDKVRNMQGLTLNSDESALYISDYIDGIYRLDLDSKKLTKLTTSENVLLKGIDGLYFSDNTLIGLHNGTKPNRVVKYQLNTNGDGIVSKEILAQADQLGEPTQGVMIDGILHYIANSPWASYDREMNFNVTDGNIIIGIVK